MMVLPLLLLIVMVNVDVIQQNLVMKMDMELIQLEVLLVVQKEIKLVVLQIVLGLDVVLFLIHNGHLLLLFLVYNFFLAPTDLRGLNPKPELRPHITVHSYGCTAALRCPNSESLKPASDALKAAGVYMVVAAHNYGPRCNSIMAQPGHYASVLTIGATNFNSNVIASFSGRGPINIDGSNRRKPDLTGPGVQVRSCVPNNRYAVFSGTSMATPTVAGGIALLWNAIPELSRNIDKTTEILEKTALHQTIY